MKIRNFTTIIMNNPTPKKGNWYFRIPLVWRILIAFCLGIVIGLAVSEGSKCGIIEPETVKGVLNFVQPLGAVLVAMLKMVVFPIIFCSLVVGAASLPLRRLGKIGVSVVAWYFLTSLCATIYGIGVSLLFSPSMENAESLASGNAGAVAAMRSAGNSGATVSDFLLSLFQNPFEALAKGHFIGVVVFAIIFGLAAKVVVDKHGDDSPTGKRVLNVLDLLDAVQQIAFKMIDWVMEYFPIGVLALSVYNFTEYGAKLFVPYSKIALCVIIGVVSMIFVVYPLLLMICCRENPYPVLMRMREAMLTAFLSRSSMATLPVSMRVAENHLRVSRTLSNFSLPLGATINMDGVCVHLPVFVILAANLFNLNLTFSQMLILVASVTLASVGVGGIPGGSIFLLFMVLENMGLKPEQTTTIVALAIGINPLLDMFETCCNITGDLICTYIIGKRNGMVNHTPEIEEAQQ